MANRRAKFGHSNCDLLEATNNKFKAVEPFTRQVGLNSDRFEETESNEMGRNNHPHLSKVLLLVITDFVAWSRSADIDLLMNDLNLEHAA